MTCCSYSAAFCLWGGDGGFVERKAAGDVVGVSEERRAFWRGLISRQRHVNRPNISSKGASSSVSSSLVVFFLGTGARYNTDRTANRGHQVHLGSSINFQNFLQLQPSDKH